MATPAARWLPSVLLVALSGCCAAGPPAPPSHLQCYRQCHETHCLGGIQCIWDPEPDPKIPTNYSLHWEPASSEDGHATSGTSQSGFIGRKDFSHGELRVWVQARNQYGSAKSEEIVFNTEDIIKPLPPKFSSSYQEPLEIHWNTTCAQLAIGTCEVRHRTEEDRDWPGHESGLHGVYTFLDPQPGTVYEFQVRCACMTGLTSDWSTILRIKSAESAPVGEVDVWRDCGMSTTSQDCFLTWKNLSNSQARGLILGYEVRIVYNNGTSSLMNMSTAEPSSHLVYDDMKWCLDSPLKDLLSASVSAYNALGATVPSYLAMPRRAGKEPNDQPMYLQMNQDNLTVSWDGPAQLSDKLKEYVVQYKEAGCPPGQGFDWIKVNKSQTTAFFKGQFKKSTQYQVSLLAVSSSHQVHQLASVAGYSSQTTPSAVPLFEVSSIGATDVTLSWEPVPISKQNGLILYYQIGLNTQEVYNVSASPQQKKMSFNVEHLRPGQSYVVWIKAVTAAGPGENVTTDFKTNSSQDDLLSIVLKVVLPVIFLIFFLLAVVLWFCRRGNKVCPLMSRCLYEKVPDPGNSHIFRQLKHQINEPLDWICIPHEPQPKISVLEVVEKKSQASDSDGLTKPVVGDGCSQMNCQNDQKEDAVTDECDRTDRRYGREEYSKMVDSDEEKDGCWSSLEEENISSGYEKHFMPTAQEIL
ncbi:interleukin 12 receptor, beta 2a, like isoform X2 [Stegastes partitus]|uniref:Interleukin 12 receptor, beta 2a, like isoform X2 n=1 Tax=Stegastes partitus TaxID=144197 RepID=A0A9Y4JYC1_9TELE|nr:PREDICTED: interleukin-12 receptor subunit beta-2-like isoform X2 [Stegastes partitus]